ncbi:GNAT family N-acetyltransferase [Dictyobacter kobayashii]|uniref:N-acetyltransferase domain-containing protein n=1 Tax=Dictyobacter kobayashii TaxID=2014872 RepID=A0A402AQF3_9CHLR|nr:GNAT family N-acetyltransferase [Dictyobacter kobayashii]GCE21322.1 hypothetical protein KDK_51220 [Dictyobacter kobayashii]
MSVASVNLINQHGMADIQKVSWVVRAATNSVEDQQYLTCMCYVSAFPMRPYPVYRRGERVIERLPQVYPWRCEWGRPGDSAFLAVDSVTQKRLGAVWCRLFSSSYDFVPGFYDSNVPIMAIAVDAAYREHGIGGLLLRVLKQTVYQQGYTALSLAVTEKNLAKLLYERHGFKVLSEQSSPGLITMSVDLTIPPHSQPPLYFF